ncbi:MAG: 50S ribosomal protein L3 N(5)-glutamine methyltransferase [Gammaproteobacteria bacterium]|nr:MAG: 50S ribosomal protein L3 N(5)-glutamine methyltransferase [Gammaproteobacteria bacterium]
MNNSIKKGGQLSSIRDFVLWGEKQFLEAELFFGHGTANALDEAAALVLKVVEQPYNLSEEALDLALSEREKARVLKLIDERINTRQPAAYLTGEALFAGLTFYVDERVLVPRSPIAELIVEQFSPWIEANKVERVLDLCTGSGCIAIACSYAFPDASIDAVDLSPEALEVCRINIAKHDKIGKVEAIESDLFENLSGRRYDIIVSNPPYVCTKEWESLPKEFHHEPDMGFKGGESGLDLVDKILSEGALYLNPKGILVVEVGSSAEMLLEKYPMVPFCWLEFEFGGDGVFLLTAEQLIECQPFFNN